MPVAASLWRAATANSSTISSDLGAERGQQRRDPAAAGADLQYPVGRPDRECLQHSPFDLRRHHHFAVSERYLGIGEREPAEAVRHELLAWHFVERAQHARVEHLPHAQLLLDHLFPGEFHIVHGGLF